MQPDAFAEARRVTCVSIAEAEGVKLRRSGARLVGACPLCGGDARSTRFNVTPATNLWICHAGCGGGSSVDLELRLRGGTALDAAKRLAGSEFERSAVGNRQSAVGNKQEAPRSTAPRAAELWRGSTADLTQCGVACRYLESRGIAPWLVLGALARLRYHPRALAGAGFFQGRRWEVHAPAILAPIIRTEGEDAGRIIGVHATYLKADGSGKAELCEPSGAEIPARKMWGKSQGGVVALTPLQRNVTRHAENIGCGEGPFVVETAPPTDPPLFVGEGLETVLSALAYWTERKVNVRAAAVLSLDNLQGGWLKDDEGAATTWPPRADPARAPWRLRDAGDVVAIVDRDMSGTRLKRRDETGRLTWAVLNGETRAQLCADLVTQHWRGYAATLACANPLRPGADLNDMVREKQ